MSSFQTPAFYSTDIERDVFITSNAGRTELRISCAAHSLHKRFEYLTLHVDGFRYLNTRVTMWNTSQTKPGSWAHGTPPPVLTATVFASQVPGGPVIKVQHMAYSDAHQWAIPLLLAEAGIELYTKNVSSKAVFKWHPKQMSKVTLKKQILQLTKTNKPMEITLKNIKQTDKADPQVFTAVLHVDGTPVYEIKKDAGEDWVDLTMGKHHNAAKLGEKATAEVLSVGWEHIHGYIQHLFDQHLENKLVDKFNKEVEDLCKTFLLFRLSKHTKAHEYEISRMKDTKHHRDYIRQTYDQNPSFGITVVEFINDRFKKDAIAPTDGLFAIAA